MDSTTHLERLLALSSLPAPVVTVFLLVIATLLITAFFCRQLLVQLSEQMLWRVVWLYIGLVCLCFIFALPEAWWLKVLLFISFAWLCKNTFRVVIPAKAVVSLPVSTLLCISIVLLLAHAPVYVGHNFVHDWSKHRTILASLVESPMHARILYTKPPIPDECRRPDMVFYYGQYAPPAFLFRVLQPLLSIFGYEYNVWLLAGFYSVWCLTAILLTLCLLPLVLQRQFDTKQVFPGLLTLLVFWFTTGLDDWYMQLRPDTWPAMPFDLGWYNSLLKHWTWAPQHLVTALTGLYALLAWRRHFTAAIFAVWSIFIAVSSPFVYIGLLPLAAFLLISDHWADRAEWRQWTINQLRQNKATHFFHAAVLGVLFFYYSSKQFPEQLQLNPYLFVEQGWVRLVIFYFVELTPFAAILFVLHRFIPRPAWRPVLLLSFMVLLLLPLVHLGKHNDLIIRASLPFLLLLLLSFTAQLTELWQKNRKLYLVTCLTALIIFAPHQLRLMNVYLHEQNPTYIRDNVYLFQYVRFDQSVPADTDHTVSGWANNILCN